MLRPLQLYGGPRRCSPPERTHRGLVEQRIRLNLLDYLCPVLVRMTGSRVLIPPFVDGITLGVPVLVRDMGASAAGTARYLSGCHGRDDSAARRTPCGYIPVPGSPARSYPRLELFQSPRPGYVVADADQQAHKTLGGRTQNCPRF